MGIAIFKSFLINFRGQAYFKVQGYPNPYFQYNLLRKIIFQIGSRANQGGNPLNKGYKMICEEANAKNPLIKVNNTQIKKIISNSRKKTIKVPFNLKIILDAIVKLSKDDPFIVNLCQEELNSRLKLDQTAGFLDCATFLITNHVDLLGIIATGVLLSDHPDGNYRKMYLKKRTIAMELHAKINNEYSDPCIITN